MSIVAERSVKAQVTPRVSAGLAEEVERQEREDDARGPEAERFVLSRGRWVRVAVVPSLLPSGFVAVGPVESPDVAGSTVAGADEVRVRRLMIAAIDRFGSARVGGAR